MSIGMNDLGCELSQRAYGNLKGAIVTILAISTIAIALSPSVATAEDYDIYTVYVTGQRSPNEDWRDQARDWGAWVMSRGYRLEGAGSMSTGYFMPNEGENVPEMYDTSRGRCPTPTERGNPINFATGAKIEEERDFSGNESEMPFSVARTYNSNGFSGQMFGRQWASNFDRGLVRSGDVNDTYISIRRGNEESIGFARVGSTNRWDEVKDGSVAYIEKNSDGTYTHFSENGFLENYALLNGGLSYQVVSIKNKRGAGWWFQYGTDAAPDGKQLLKILHSNGKSIDLTWQDGRVKTIKDPAGNLYTYNFNYGGPGSGDDVLTGVVLPEGTIISYLYVPSGQVFSGNLIGKEINSVRYSYFSYTNHIWEEYDQFSGEFGYSNRYVAASTDHGNGVNRYSFEYAVDTGTITSVVETNPLGKKTTYTFENGKLKSIAGQSTASCIANYSEITYDQYGYQDLVVRQDGSTIDYDYNAKGQLLKKTEAAGSPFSRATTYVWDATRNVITEVQQPDGLRVNITYDSLDQVTSKTETNTSQFGVVGQSRTTQFSYTYHANGLTATRMVDGPLPGTGDAIVHIYDAQGNLTYVQNSLGHTTAYSNYNGLGLPGRIVGVNGDITDYTYDARGRARTVTGYISGQPSTTTYTYWDNGLLASITFPDGVVESYEYDSARRMTAVNRPGSAGSTERVVYTYDNASNVTATKTYQVTISGATLIGAAYVDYDELSRPKARRGNNGQNIRYTYDANGNLKTIKDSANRVTTLAYDALDRIESSTDSLTPAGVTRYEYDAGDRITKVTDPRNLVTTYMYDGFGQAWAQYSPDTGTTTTQYNAAGQPTLFTRHDGSVLGYSYDVLGRVTSVGTGANLARNFSYDWCTAGKSRLCGVSTNDATQALTSTIYAYTPQGQVDHKRDIASPGGTPDWTAYTYDGMGRLTGIGYPTGVGAGYGYAGGKLQTMTATIGGVAQTVVSNMRYLPYGPAVSWDTGNGLTRNLYYDQNLNPGDLRLTGLTTMDGSATLQSQLLAYDADTRITSITNFANPGHSQTYGYDALSRLTAVTSPAGNETLQYDANNNRTMHDWLAAIANDVDPASNRILRDYTPWNDGINYTYDGRGNRATQSWNGSTATYGYDGFNRLASVSRNTVSTYQNSGYASMTYPAATTVYGTNALDQRVTKFNMTLSARYVYSGQNTLLAENNNGQWTSHLWLGGQPIGLVRGNTLYWTHTDHLTRPEMVTNAAKQVVWKAKNLHSERAVVTDTIGGYNLGLPGQYFDAESGLWYNGFRYYDSRLGSYTQSDPIGLAGGTNTYAYAGGNPVNAIDFLGLDTYLVNRDLAAFGDSARSLFNPVTHTFVFTTNPDGSIEATYSWGNDANVNGWNLNQPLDIKTAQEALARGLARRVGSERTDEAVMRAFGILDKKENEHKNGVIAYNCKTEAEKLLQLARDIQFTSGTFP